MPRKPSGKSLVNAQRSTIRDVFANTYTLDYYQRDYVWEEPQVERLIADLTDKFLGQWSEEHTSRTVGSYDPYFLGSFITYSVRERADQERTYLADGQQRVVTLQLLLIHLRRLIAGLPGAEGKAALLSTLIASERYDRRTFSIDHDVYADCFAALLYDRPFHTDGAPPNVQKVWEAYQHIETHFPAEIRGETLIPFVDWLLHRVSLVALDAGDQERAVEMFQTMNDRGVHLSPLDHLKRYLLEDAGSDAPRLEARWTSMVAALERIERGAAPAYFRAFFRARFAESGQHAAIHEWVRRHADEIWPQYRIGDRSKLFTDVLHPLHSVYGTLLKSRTEVNPQFPAVRFNAVNGIADQFDLTLASLQPQDPPAARIAKAAMVSGFLDLFFVTQTLNDETIGQKQIDELVAGVRPAVRKAATVDELREVLGGHAADWPKLLDHVPELRYDVRRRFVHYVLTRITAWVEVGAGNPDPTDHFLRRWAAGQGFQIEHLFAADHGLYEHLEPDPRFYSYLRDRIGGLLLLSGSDNAAFGAMPLAKKLGPYSAGSALAGLLNPQFLDHGKVKLRRFLAAERLTDLVRTYDETAPLEPFIHARGEFYLAAARRIWSLPRLGLATADEAAGAVTKGHTHHGVRIADLLRDGRLVEGEELIGIRKGRTYHAQVVSGGQIRTASAPDTPAPSRAMFDAVGTPGNGWSFWRVARTKERLDEIRAGYLKAAA